MTRASDVSSMAFRIWSREALSWLYLTVTWEDIKVLVFTPGPSSSASSRVGPRHQYF